MKKLLITTMAAVSVGLCAKAGLTVETFESYGEGSLFGTLTEDSSKYKITDGWETETTLENLFTVTNIANYVGDGTYPEKADRPSKSDSVKALAIDTSAPLLRYADSSKDPQSLSDTPIFFDSVVQFTATDVAPLQEGEVLSASEGGNNTAKNKLMVWLYSSPEDLATTPGLFNEESAITNLVVTAGFLENNSTIKVKHYLTDVPIAPESWHRLTIKSFEESDYLKFNVWVDGNPIKIGDATKPFAFDSMVEDGVTNYDKLQGVAFDGKGAVDDIVFTTKDPFAVASYTVKTTINDVDGAAYTKQYSIDGGSQYTVFAANGSSPFVENLLIPQSVENIKFKFLVYHSYKVEGATKTTETVDHDGERYIYWEKQIAVSSISFTDNVGEITLNVVLGEEVTYPTVKPNGDSATQETLSESAVAAIEEALAGVETMPDALTVIVNEKEYFGDEAVAKINEVVAMFKAAKEGETLKFFDAYGVMKVSFKATNPLMETETAEATDYEAKVGESAATVTSNYTVNKETVDLTPGAPGENEAVTFKLVIKPVSSTGSDTGSAVQE